MPAFTLEIGTEELPARFLLPTQKELDEKFTLAFAESGLSYATLLTFTTPRRLCVLVEGLDAISPEREEIVIGPSTKVAYDVGGRPTRAAEGFAKTHGVNLDDVFTHEGDKGTYIAVHKRVGGESAAKLLEKMCPAIISSLSFAKRMKWGSGDFYFARPLRWFLALLDTEIIPFTLAGLASGRETYGHRVHGVGPFSIASASAFVEVLATEGKIVLSGEERRKQIIESSDALAAAKQGKVLWNEALLTEVQGLCEHPVPIIGSFDSSFLEVPREVLLTSMQSHQKSFGVEGTSGNLLPYFITVLNMKPLDTSLVRKGWERVLRARLEDARFFWKNDCNTSFSQWLDSLETVVFLAPLGSMADKTRRIAELCGWLANNIQYVDQEQEKAHVDDAIRAGRISKADLVSDMVKEFDTLQGIMGGIYASRMGEGDVVAAAIAEQYLPAGPESPVPASITGALLSIADKADTLVGCFGLGMIPTGTADPYALRRATLGIARILLEKKLRVSMRDFFAKAQEVYGKREWKLEPDQALIRLHEFFSLRFKNHCINVGSETLYVEAAFAAGVDDPWAANARLAALVQFSKTTHFNASVQSFKRVANIIRKQTEESPTSLTGNYDASLLQEPQEIALAVEVTRLAPVFAKLWEQDRFNEMFEVLDGLRPFVDSFFDSVMVMSDDIAVRNARLNLLQALLNPFEQLADFAALQM